MGELRVMGRKGDVAVAWDETKQDEVRAAETEFEKYRTLGYLTFRQDEPGASAEVIKTFDPKAKRVIVGAPMQGG